MTYNLYFKSLEMSAKLLGFVPWLMYFSLSFALWNFNLENTQIQVLNSFLEFESNINKGRQTILIKLRNRSYPNFVKYMKLLVFSMELSSVVVPILQFVMLTYLPCTPPFLISMIPGFCGDKRQDITGRVLIQILVHVLESVVQLQLYLSAASMISYSLFVGCTCVLCYLSDFMRWLAIRAN